MSIYAIGDVQGCFSELERLLEKITFDAATDQLWFTGDLVNRGPHSLEVLRLVKSLGKQQVTILGNHDLHLLAVKLAGKKPHVSDTLDAILSAPDSDDLIDWLRHRPFLHQAEGYLMTHAGIAPIWSTPVACELAREMETVLQSELGIDYLAHMYGSEPCEWQSTLSGQARWRCITNYFTRMRFCDAAGRLDLTYRGEQQGMPAHLIPWFEVEGRLTAFENIIFGHWAALKGEVSRPHVYALDTGCVWGNCLTAMRLSDRQRFSVPCGLSSSD